LPFTRLVTSAWEVVALPLSYAREYQELWQNSPSNWPGPRRVKRDSSGTIGSFCKLTASRSSPSRVLVMR
jgi:hypothetical protein